MNVSKGKEEIRDGDEDQAVSDLAYLNLNAEEVAWLNEPAQTPCSDAVAFSEEEERFLQTGLSDDNIRFVQEAEQVEGLDAVLKAGREAAAGEEQGMVEVPVDPKDLSSPLIHKPVSAPPPGGFPVGSGAAARPPTMTVASGSWSCPFPGCDFEKGKLGDSSKPNVASRRSHLKNCIAKQVKYLGREHPEWAKERVREEIQSRVEPAFLNGENRKWCPGATCCDMIGMNAKQHKMCGWLLTKGAPMMPLLPRRPPAERPSDAIDSRHLANEAEVEEVNRAVQCWNTALEAVQSSGMPSLEEAASMSKRMVNNPNNRALHPAVGLQMVQALHFTVRLMVEKKDMLAAWSLWFMLAPCTMLRQGEKQSKSDWGAKMGDKLRRWMEGDFVNLWAEAVAADAAAKDLPLAEGGAEVMADTSEEQILRRVNKLMRVGRFADAATALQAERPSPLTPETIEILRAKFPVENSPLGTMEYDPNLLQRIKVDAVSVEACLQTFPRGSSAGLSGIVPESLSSAVRYCEEFGIPLMDALAQMVETLVNGKAPAEVAAWMVGGRLIPIGVKVRPVVVSDVLGRLASKIVRQSQSDLFPDIFRGIQGGVGEASGIDRTIHLLREDLAHHSEKLDWGILIIDFRNGFNEASRATTAAEVRARCPNMMPWFRFCYGRPIELVLSNGELIQGLKGVCQGDPLASFLFSLNMQPILDYIEQTWKEDGLSIIRAFLDDGAFSGPVPVLKEILMYLLSEDVQRRGLLVGLSKCVLYMPNAGLCSTLHRDYDLPADLRITSEGIVLLGTPLGSSDFCEQYLSDIVVGVVRDFHDRLSLLDSPQLALVLLRMCGSATRVSHLLRCMPPDSTASMCMAVDESTDQQLQRILGMLGPANLSAIQWQQVHLPLSMSGLGLPLTSSIKEAAYLASVHAVRHSLEASHDTRSSNLTHSLLSATETYNLLVAGKDKIGGKVFKRNFLGETLLQKDLMRNVHRHTFNQMMTDGAITCRDLGRIKDQTGRGASAWMSPVFQGLQLVIPDEGFRLLIKRHLGCQFFSVNVVPKCARSDLAVSAQRKRCNGAQDPFLYHSTDLCRTTFIQRHNMLANRLKALCFRAGIQSVSEVQCIPGSRDVPADLYIHSGPKDIPLAVDLAVVSPICDTAVKDLNARSRSGLQLRQTEINKCHKYKAHFDGMNGSIRFLPFVVSTFGNIGHQAEVLIGFIAAQLAKRWRMSATSALAFVTSQVSAAVMKIIAISMSQALASILLQVVG